MMRKLLSIFTMTVLTITTSTNIVACNNSNVPIPTINTVKFKLMNGIKEATSLAIDSKDHLYTSDKKGNIYKCLAGENEFKKFATIKNIEIDAFSETYIRIDNDDNIFFIFNKEIYKCLARENTFNQIVKMKNDIVVFTLDKNNNIYIGSNDNNIYDSNIGTLYKCLAGKNTFIEVTNIQRPISSIVIDKNNNIFLSSMIFAQNTEIYKCLAGKNIFQKINSINNTASSNLALDSNNNIYIGITISDSERNTSGIVYKCLAGETNFVEITRIKKGNFYNLTLDKNNNIYAIDNAKSVYQMLANDKNIHMINNQLSMGNDTIITAQKNKVYISNSYYGVYESD
ncbi:lipoprotein [Spiroplasma endosymbiont of Polydrusus pterygomalis]|uniref:lipoprotein n=1 Tax=Spiroplasma endosymbiont of Polydrusus pterygomalis TaxID=3139327 RepID=UPI003CCB64B8